LFIQERVLIISLAVLRWGRATLVERVIKIARSGDRAYRAADILPFPAGRVPSGGVSKEF
jgi:hypothetical protein